ncbi:protein of unknown function [Paraburkholderia kururiensis]
MRPVTTTGRRSTSVSASAADMAGTAANPNEAKGHRQRADARDKSALRGQRPGTRV